MSRRDPENSLVNCQARRKIKSGLVYCLEPDGQTCCYVTHFEFNLICCHPKRNEIIARTVALSRDDAVEKELNRR
jgi:hypothetical protein